MTGQIAEDVVEKLRQLEDIYQKWDYAERTVRRLKKKVSELRTDSERAKIIGLDRISRELLELSRYIEAMILPKVEKAYRELSEEKDRLTDEIRSKIDRCAEIHLDLDTWQTHGHLFRLDTDGRFLWDFLMCKLVDGEFVITDRKYKHLLQLYDKLLQDKDAEKLMEEYLRRFGKTISDLKP